MFIVRWYVNIDIKYVGIVLVEDNRTREKIYSIGTMFLI